MVLCPSAARFQWRDELLRWLPELAHDAGVRVHVPLSTSAATATANDADADADADALEGAGAVSGASAPPSLSPSALVHVLSYDLAVRCSAALSALAPRVIVCDESQYLKSRTAQRTHAVLPLLAQASRALLLSGTPALSSPSELYTQLHVLAPQVFGSWTSFAHRFCDAKRTRYGLDVSGTSELGPRRLGLRPICCMHVLTTTPSLPQERPTSPSSIPSCLPRSRSGERRVRCSRACRPR